jgi:hypothetical protein
MLLTFITKLISPETSIFYFLCLMKKRIRIQNIKMLLFGLIRKHILITITITLLSLFITNQFELKTVKQLLSLFHNSNLKHIFCFYFRTISERTRRRVIITFHRADELTTAFEFQAAHLFITPRTSLIPTLLKTSPKPKNDGNDVKVPIKEILSPGKKI